MLELPEGQFSGLPEKHKHLFHEEYFRRFPDSSLSQLTSMTTKQKQSEYLGKLTWDVMVDMSAGWDVDFPSVMHQVLTAHNVVLSGSALKGQDPNYDPLADMAEEVGCVRYKDCWVHWSISAYLVCIECWSSLECWQDWRSLQRLGWGTTDGIIN